MTDEIRTQGAKAWDRGVDGSRPVRENPNRKTDWWELAGTIALCVIASAAVTGVCLAVYAVTFYLNY